ncbi:amino acid ABC transporter substrate-binding protein [Castellaniella sp.]|uniref:amino acid ABC transporter substrate-binding protein n=1 Tax=Castellaniella sp. TaxID=1955812 RepID=UPI00355E5F8C
MKSHRRRRLLALMAATSLPAFARADTPRFVLQNEPSLKHCVELLLAATKAAGFPAAFDDAPKASEARNLHETMAGRIHVNLLPASPARLEMVRQGKLRMIPIPLERGLLGWRACFTLQGLHDRLAQVRNLAGLRAFTIGQGTSWWDVEIYRKAGISTREVQAWRDGEFAEQMHAGVIDLFPMGLEESLNYFLPHFRAHYPELTLDPHLLLRYPWYRFVWVSAHPGADALYQALQHGFDLIGHDGRFESIWNQYRRLPPASSWQSRTVISLHNPYYAEDSVPERYRHLLLHPHIA